VARRTPQEKKRLSYRKDRRNVYGENSKSSRRNIRKDKRTPHRANRRRENSTLEAVKGVPDGRTAEAAEQRLLATRPKSWRKDPDAPLAAFVERGLRRRVRRGIDHEEKASERIGRIRRRLREPAP
jgi:hypothetical protein